MENVDQQIPPVGNQPPIKTASNLSFAKALAYGFVIVSIGISIAVGGYLLGANKSKPQPATQISVTPSLSPVPTVDPIATWKTYTNTQSGFELKYPQKFLPVNVVDGKSILAFTDRSNTKQRLSTLPDISLRTFTINSGDDYRNLLIKDAVFSGSGMHPKSFGEFSSKKIGDNAVYHIQTGRFEGVLSINYYLVIKNQIFAFTLTSSPVDWTNANFKSESDPLNQILLQILSTFKFTP